MKNHDYKNPDKSLTLGEEIANSISHGLGFLLGITALVLLIVKANTSFELAGALIFGISIMSLYLMSTLYHAFPKFMKVKYLFEKFDHMFIYVLVGGTFAPVLLNTVEQPKGLYIFIGQWIIIAIAMTIKAIKFHAYPMLHIAAYLGLGWSALFIIEPIYLESPMAMNFLIAGGVAYSVGVVFYITRLFKFTHFIWHLFVLTGTTFHFLAIYGYLY